MVRLNEEVTRNINGGWWTAYTCPYCSYKTYESSWNVIGHIVVRHPFNAIPKVINAIRGK